MKLLFQNYYFKIIISKLLFQYYYFKIIISKLLFQNYFSLCRHPSETILFQRVHGNLVLEIISKLSHRLTETREYYPKCSLSLI